MGNYNKILEGNTVLESERLMLRPFSLKDTKDVFLYAQDEVVTKYLTWSTHNSVEETQKTIEEFYMKKGVFAIELKAKQMCIGCIELRINEKHNKASFGYVLNRHYWNKGYMTEALQLLLDLSFTKLELNRIESTHYVGNEASGQVMKKCGMKYEGTGRQEVKIKGIYYDVVHYGILREEWIKGHLD
ncbi:MAG: GNAT family N-acetyltransferase [Epulopiscium sp.]|nr:GNAT family N-acetyltransferase [Candidatus Epulonipiscium sp.]